MDAFDGTTLLALAIVACLAGYLLLRACAGSRGAAALLLLLIVVSFDVSLRTRAFDDKSLDLQVLAKLCIWAAGGVFALSRWSSVRALLREPVTAAWVVFIAWLAITGLSAPNLLYSEVALSTVVLVLLFFLAIVGKLDRVAIGEAILFGAAVISAASIVGYFLVPNTARLWIWDPAGFVLVRSDRLVGFTSHANAIGGLAAFGLLAWGLFCRDAPRSGRWLRRAAGLLCLTALVMSGSRTSAAAMLAALALNELFRLYDRARLTGVVAALGGAVIVAISGLLLISESGFSLNILARSGDVTDVSTLAGRTQIWAASLELAAQKPLFGWGYASSAYIVPQLSNKIGFAVGQPHNLGIQVLLTSGIVGLGLFLLAVTVSIWSAMKTNSRGALCLLAWVLIGGLTESQGFVAIVDLSFGSLALAVALTAQASREQSHSRQLSDERARARPRGYTYG
jgi:O-antigen ligase